MYPAGNISLKKMAGFYKYALECFCFSWQDPFETQFRETRPQEVYDAIICKALSTITIHWEDQR